APHAWSWLSLELPHHPHVLVLDVVAMEHVATGGGPRDRVELIRKRQDDFRVADVAPDEHRVLAPALERRRRLGVTRQDKELRQVDVHGMDPPAAGFEAPDLHGPVLWPGVDAVFVKEPAVDDPRPVGALELERTSGHDPREQLLRTIDHVAERSGYLARVGHRGP